MRERRLMPNRFLYCVRGRCCVPRAERIVWSREHDAERAAAANGDG